jgi:hypothetical protein
LPDPLKDRFIVMSVSLPGEEHFDVVLRNVRSAEARRVGIRPELLPWLSAADQEWLRRAWLRGGRSLRVLERAHAILTGERAVEEASAMTRPH